jgi:putative flippase GtrA
MKMPPDRLRPERLRAAEPPNQLAQSASGKLDSLRKLFRRLPWRTLARWWIVGLVFLGIGTTILYIFTGLLRMPLLLGTLLSAEVTLLVRFFFNDSWVFGHRRPTWKRLWQFHVASAGGSAIWWIVANTLPRFGVHYLIASAIGSACSMFLSITTNFLWIWRHRDQSARVVVARTEALGQ